MKIHSIAISALATLDMHALNNEGAEGNAMMTRMVEIVKQDGSLASVNAVSGDMMKHIQAEHLFRIAGEKGLPLCGGCRRFDANRICADEEFTSTFDKKEPADKEVLSKALQRCVLDDCEGILITTHNRAIARKSCVEFGWVVGRPENTRTGSYFHAKYVPEGRGKGSGAGENLGQNIFHRPASSGQYAVVLNLDLFRVGRNDITLENAISQEDRQARAGALLDSVLYTFLKMSGAHRNTQNPHLLDFTGAVTISSTPVPAPTVSPLNGAYIEEIEGICRTLADRPGGVECRKFTGLGEFTQKMTALAAEAVPYGA